MENNNIDLIEQIRTIVAPLAKKPESILIRRLDKPEDLEKREQHYVIVCENDDVMELILVLQELLSMLLQENTKREFIFLSNRLEKKNKKPHSGFFHR